MSEQPTTCRICGARTDIIGDFWHTKLKLFINECLDNTCKNVFLEMKDETEDMIDVTCALIHNEQGQILAAQRSKLMSLPLKWEFPGGKIEANELPEDCLIREIKEELGIKIDIIKELPSNQYSYPSLEINLIPFICNYVYGGIILREHTSFKWLNRNELLDLDWADADIAIVNYYLNHIHAI